MQITFNFSELWYIFCLGQPKSILKKALSRPLNFKISALFKDLYRKDFSMTPSKIQGLFKTVPTLKTLTDQATKIFLHFVWTARRATRERAS